MLDEVERKIKSIFHVYYNYIFLGKIPPIKKKRPKKRGVNYNCGNCRHCFGDEKRGYFCIKLSKWHGSWWIGYYSDLSKNRCENWERIEQT